MLVEGDGAEEGEVDMAVRREKRDQREQAELVWFFWTGPIVNL